VTARNAVIGGEFILIASQGGINFFIGNNVQSDGKTAMAPAHFGPGVKSKSLYRDSVQVSAKLEAERLMGVENLTSGEVSSYWFGRSFEFIGKHPLEWLKLTCKKAYFLVNGHEIPSNREIYRVRDWSSVLRVLLVDKPIGLPFGLLFPLAVTGMLLVVLIGGEGGSAHRLLMLYSITYAATVVGFFVTARHRLPLVPVLIPYAAFSLVWAIRGFKDLSGGRVVALILVFVATLAVSNSRLWGVRDDVTRELYMNMGRAYGRQGRYEEALEEFKKALREAPNLYRARFNSGVAYFALGRYNEALGAFVRTLKIQPRFAPAWSHIGKVHTQLNDLVRAEGAYRKALEIDPRLAIAHYNLARVLYMKGDLEGYVLELEAAVKADPYFIPANISLAEYLISQGRNENAKGLLMNVLRINPTNERAREYLRNITGGAP
jgi:Flp pilus assembly protein TadD